MRCLAFAVLLTLQAAPSQDPSDIDRWIADLGHEEIVRREEAQGHLTKAGEKALSALKKALDSKDAEKVARLRLIIDEIERPIRERLHDAEQRRLRLPLYTVEFKETRAEEAFKKLGELLGKEFKIESDPDARLTYSAKQVPLQQILDAIEDRLDVSIRDKSTKWEVSRLSLPRKPRAYAPGVTFEFNSRSAKADGKVIGTRVQVKSLGEVSASIDSWDVKGPEGRPRAVRHCESCGPGLALVEGDPGELRIRLKGRIIWTSVHQLKVDNPGVEQSYRVGPFTIAYSFPGVMITTPVPVSPRLFPHARIEGRLKEGVVDEGWIGVGGVFGRKIRQKDPAKWCDCGPGAKPVIANPPPEPITSQEFGPVGINPVTDYVSIAIHLTRYFEEALEVDVILPSE